MAEDVAAREYARSRCAVMDPDSAFARVDHDHEFDAAAEVDVDLACDIALAIFRGEDFDRDGGSEARGLELFEAVPSQTFELHERDVGHERPAYVAGRRDAKAPLGSDLAAALRPIIEGCRDLRLQTRMAARRAHFAPRPPAGPLGLRFCFR